MTDQLPIVTLDRFRFGDDGVCGHVRTPLNLFECFSLELPPRLGPNGRRLQDLSCIYPDLRAGQVQEILCVYGESPNRKNKDGSPLWCYRLQDVADAAGVLIHAGNFAGDKKLGYVAQVEGCVLLGLELVDMEIPAAIRIKHGVTRARQLGVTSSGPTIARFEEAMDRKPFKLQIRGIGIV